MLNIKNKKTVNLKFLFLGFGFYILLFYFSSSVPFFWDMANFSKIAQFYLDSHLQKWVVPEYMDDGHPPLFGLYLALFWKLLGKSILVFHLSILPFLLGVVWEFYKLAKKWIHPKAFPFAMILLIFEPTFLSQSIIGGQDILIIYFFLLGVNSILSNHKLVYSLSLLCIALLNLRGFLLTAPLFIFHLLEYKNFYSEKKISKQHVLTEIIVYIPLIVAMTAWAMHHYSIRSWAFLPPTRMAHRSIADLEMMFRNTIYITWKMFDFGRIILFIIFIWALFSNTLKNKLSKKLGVLLFICTLFFYSSMVPLTNPIGHRYFMIVYILLILAVAQILFHLKKKYSYLLLTISILCMVSGNFILYPEKYGNGWDSSIKFISYFKVRNKMNNYIEQSKIDTKKTGTAFPMRAEPYATDLVNKSYYFGEKDSIDFKSYSYILQSNICNTFSPQQMELLQSNQYSMMAEFSCGQVYMKLFRKIKNRD